MTNEELRLKVINAQARVEKRAAVEKKQRDRLYKLIATGADACYIQDKRDEIKEAEDKLNEALEVLASWKSKLSKKISDDEFIEANTPAVLKRFLDNWKRGAIDYYRAKYDDFIRFRQDLEQQELEARREALRTLPELERAREIHRGEEPDRLALHNLFPRRPVEAFLESRGLGYQQIQKKLAKAGDQVIFKMLEIRDPEERLAWLEKAMEQERQAKLFDLTGRVMKVVGRITDASGLYIASTGELNGAVKGTEGQAKVTTVGAGGYNVQCFHFRTLIHEIK